MQELVQGFRVSPQQKRLWLLQRDSAAFRVRGAIALDGALDTQLLKEAVFRVVQRHEILRTTFECLPGMRMPVQVAAEDGAPLWRDHDLSDLDPARRELRLDELFSDLEELSLEVEQSLTGRFTLIRKSAEDHVLFVSLPALCADARSLENLAREIHQAYSAGLEDEQERDETVQYAQFSAWQHELLEEKDGEEGREYWLQQAIATAPPPSLPFEAEPTGASRFAPSFLGIDVEGQLFDAVESIARRNVVPTSIFLLACWQTLLWRLSPHSDIPVCLRFDGRVYKEMSGALGLYERWPLVQCRLEADQTFTKVLGLVSRSVSEAHEWQEYFSWEQFAALLAGEPEDAYHFTGFDYAESFAPQFARGVGFSLSRQYSCTERLKLRLSCVRSDKALRVEFHYDPALYSAGTIENLAERFSKLLESAARQPAALIGELEIIGDCERRRLLVERNAAAAASDSQACLPQLFEAQAALTPDRLALIYQDQRLSYRELNERANQLAHRLNELGVGAETRVALCVERSAEMVISLLGILKSGGAYVPLDAAQPTARLSLMLSDARAEVLITQKAVAERLPSPAAQVFCLESERASLAAQSSANPDVKVAPENLAYVIYTSGSTGHPKGAMITHSSVINLVEALSQAVDIGRDKALRVSVNAPLSFDSSVKQVMQLLRGHTLFVVPEQIRRDGESMLRYLAEEQVEVLDCTPSQLRMLLAAGLGAGTGDGTQKMTLGQVLVGGEAISPSLWEQLSAATGIEYFNVYGPTECTVDATVQRIEPGAPPTIGRAIANVQVYVLDQQMRLAPDGVSGELCIGGAGVGRGYLDRVELTAERFIPDHYGRAAGGRLYRTGDVARWTENGRLEFLGRTDGQVKVRGSRIEVGEVEAAVGAYVGVRECVVVAREDVPEDVRLVAYVVAEAEPRLAVSELRSFLREKLPEYMMPAAFVMMESLPFTSNGKVDRRALPVPEQAPVRLDEEFLAERTPTQAVLAGIWEHLLGVGPVRVEDDFFDLGGHSLLAMQLISRVREAFNLEVPLPALFEAPTVAGFAERIESLMRDERQLAPPIVPVSRDRNLPLSFAQQRLWFLHQFNPADLAYNVPLSVRLNGPLDVFIMQRCLTEIVRRHEPLRTTFMVVDGEPVQVIHPAGALVLPVADLSELPEAAREIEVQRLANEEGQRPFDLANGPMLRTCFLRLGERQHVALFSMHHIGSDGWSLAILTKEVALLYDAYSAGIASPLPELPVQYADFAFWQRNWLRGEVLEEHLSYWRQQLDGAPPVLSLLCDRPRSAAPTSRGAIQIFALSPGLSAKLKAMCGAEGVTLFMLLVAAFQTLLSRLSGQEDIVVSSAMANRTRGEIEGLIGFFVNTLVLRTDLSGNPGFRELLKRVREVTLGAYAHQDLPFEKLVEELQPERNLGHAPLSQVMITLQNTPRKASGVSGLQLSSKEADTGDVKFDLDLSISEGTERIEMSLSYKTALFNDSTITLMLATFDALLGGIVADPSQRLSELPMLSETKRRQLLTEWNDTEATYPRETCIHQLFEQQVERTPAAIAVEFENVELSYRELNERANQLARYLRHLGVKPGDRVGLQLEHSLETLVALLGSLKAGAAYVPIEPAHPRAKLAFVLADADISLLLTQQRLVERLPETEVNVLCLDTDWAAIAAESRENVSERVPASDLAYVIYTSGSSGVPKGVKIQHAALVNYIWWAKDVYLQHESLDFPLYSSLAFDLTVTSIYTPLITGNRVVVYRNDRRAAPLSAVLRENKVGVLKLTPSHLSMIQEGDHRGSRIKRLIVGGEVLETGLARKIHESFGGAVEIYNEYGPTEATVGCMIHRYDVTQDTRPTVPIGKPAANVQIYVLDDEQNPVAENVSGELYLAGDGLAAGYLQRAELTAERFVPNPFTAGAKMYRSGDLARRLPEGVLELLGRRDEQVKYHGYRVELNELRCSLNEHPQVRDSVVVISKDAGGADMLVAYYVSRQELEVAQLRDFLAERIIEETIPNVFMHLKKLPLTLNGKVNYQALPTLAAAKETLHHVLAVARTPIEELLVGIWSQVLQVAEVGIYNNFFELGGHSLLATQIIARVREVLRVEITLRLLFESPTVAGMAESVEKLMKSESAAAESSPIVPVERNADLPLSYAQQRLWFIEQLEPESATYNVASAARLRGKLSVAALEQTFSEITRRHEVLRTSFTTIDGAPVPVVAPARSADLPLVDLSELPAAGREAEAKKLAGREGRRPFNLATYPLLRTTLVRLSEAEHFVLLTMHHIISDGWSMGVLVREVSALYEAYSRGATSPLAELPIQYADYAAWQRQQLGGEALEQRLGYWRQQLAGAPALLELPTDYPRPALPATRGDTHSLRLTKPLMEKIKELGRRRGTTLFITLLAAFQTLLLRYTGQEDISIGTPVAGRNRLEMESLIGFFVNTLVMRTDLAGDPSFVELLDRVRQTTLGAYSNQEVPFEKLVDELQVERSLSHTPLFQVLLVVQHAGQERLELPGLALSGVNAAVGTAKFDLTLHVVEEVDHLSATFEYKTDLFKGETIKRLGRHFEKLLEGIVADPQQRLSELPLLGEAERQQVLAEWNDTTEAIEQPQWSVHEAFEAQVERAPDAIALVFGDQRLTYGELNLKANQLAHHLQSHGVGPETLVGICVERSFEMVVGILGILKAGGAYVPLDINYPPERLAYMLADAKVRLLVTQTHLLESAAIAGVQTVCLDTEWQRIAHESAENLPSEIKPANAAYVIYTSGSTGKPKGVVVQHGGVRNLVHAQVKAFDVKRESHVLQFASLSFDASASEIFITLLSGATLGLATREALLPGPNLLELMREQATTIVTLPPSVLATLDGDQLPELKSVVSAGEACTVETVERWGAGRRFTNAYGPTEVTVCATVFKCVDVKQKPAIGRPIANAEVYVLDKHLQPVPVGVTGELYVGGSGVARGYLNQPHLTAARFVPNPFADSRGQRLYRTGDLVRFLAHGDLEFIGRSDHQVKVRGFRIELGEIEEVLSQHAALRESVVVARDDVPGDRRLVAYVVARNEQSITSSELRNFLKEQLPDYMIPAAFIVLDELPLTPNGKINRALLPEPDTRRPEMLTRFVLPVTEIERAIAAVWQDVLALEQVGINDNFFELGGNSLLIVKVYARLRVVLAGRELMVVDLFRCPTIGSLAEYLTTAAVSSVEQEAERRQQRERIKAGKKRQERRRRRQQKVGTGDGR